MNSPVIYWFRQDLRLEDLPALEAAATDSKLIPVYILDDDAAGDWAPGAASRWWLHRSLAALADDIAERGGKLILLKGDSGDHLARLAAQAGADTVYCSRRIEPWAREQERAVAETLSEQGVRLRVHPGSLLFEPEAVVKGDGEPYQVFTPYWRACRSQPEPPAPRPAPDDVDWYESGLDSDSLDKWQLLPQQPNWAASWDDYWQPGAEGAAQKLHSFLSGPLADYADGRDRPASDSTSRLSPHLQFGEISPRTVWQMAREAEQDPALSGQAEKFLSELGWREFSHYLLWHWPDLPHAPFKPAFEKFPWQQSDTALAAWQQGRTGYPLVDAGMRELWATGYMHNRVRMVTASFLTKHLRLHWRLGADWFWDTLVDASLANNSASWQWVAGSGADAAPYFRIFNPIIQGEKFDPDGDYVRRWVPELKDLPDRFLNRPWEASPEVLEQAGVILGEQYPQPLVEHKAAREAALAAYESIR